jgi:hypothetical protein
MGLICLICTTRRDFLGRRLMRWSRGAEVRDDVSTNVRIWTGPSTEAKRLPLMPRRLAR